MQRRLSLMVLMAFGLLVVGACEACGGRSSAGEKGKLTPLPVGAEVPALVRVDHQGQVVSLRSSQPSLVYFYPKDGTPGCTKEACAFRDAWQRYSTAGVRVIGVSADSEADHRKFAEEHGLPFSLIADQDRIWADAFGVGPVSFALPGAHARVSFLIDAKGRIAKVYEDVDPGVHAEEVLDDAKELQLID